MQKICKIEGCRSLDGNVTELDAIGFQFKPYLTTGCMCTVCMYILCKIYAKKMCTTSKNMQKICKIHEKYMKIYPRNMQKYAQYAKQCAQYAKNMQNDAKKLQKICKKYANI